MTRKAGLVRCEMLLPPTILGVAMVLLCALGMPGCSSTSVGNSAEPNAAPVKIQLSGSSTLGPLAREIGDRYESLNPHVRVEVQTGGSSRGISDVNSGLADIGMSSRTLKDSEQTGRQSWTVAMDGVCFIVNVDNPIESLTKDQLGAILRGEVDNWKSLGGNDDPIVMVNRSAGRSELDLVSKFFGIKESEIHADLVVGENQQGIKTVANTRNSICFMSVGASEDAVTRGTKIKMLPLDGVAANVANVESDSFPLSRPLIFVTAAAPDESVAEFIKYAQSEDVHDLVRQLSYVPIN